jgi:hypothetical protein
MSDDLNKKRPQDASKISLKEEWEVRYWCNELGCTRQQLIDAVTAVGHSTSAVREHLRQK